MSKVRSSLWAWALTTTLAVVFGAHATPAVSADSIPANAHPRRRAVNSGWECNEGYREKGGECVQVQVPPNGYPTYSPYGRGWNCHRGYRPVEDRCVAVRVPANGYL